MKKITFLVALVCFTVSVFAQNPRTWILTDYTGPTKYDIINNGKEATAFTDAESDPDDQVALAMYMMMANKFDTRAIVLGSTSKNTQLKTLDLYQKAHGDAYAIDRKCMGTGYPENLNVKESSLTAGTNNKKFKLTDDYKTESTLPQTVKDLVNELARVDASNNAIYSSSKPLYVLVWGPMAEVAMATKHLIDNPSKSFLLNRMFVISHWTSSFLAQTGTPCSSFPSSKIQFNPANCRENCEACFYMHDQAIKSGAKFKFVDLGSIGQGGIVNGSTKYFTGGTSGVLGTEYKEFQKSKLGDLFVKSRFYSGHPDGSDCATFLALLGTYGVTLSGFNSNGDLTKAQEETALNAFNAKGVQLMKDLRVISDKAKTCTTTTTPPPATTTTFKAYPNPTTGVITLPEVVANDKITVTSVQSGTVVLTKTITTSGSTTLDISSKANGNYVIKIVRNGVTLTREITKQ